MEHSKKPSLGDPQIANLGVANPLPPPPSLDVLHVSQRDEAHAIQSASGPTGSFSAYRNPSNQTQVGVGK